jgi:hypothetical protein
VATTFSSILRGVNRPANDKLNVLLCNTDEKFQFLLSTLGHNFYFINNPQSPPWNTIVREKPSNCILLDNKDLSEQVNDIALDLIVCQNRSRDYTILAKLSTCLSCPILGINNFLPFPEINQFAIQAMADQVYNAQVFSSKFVCNSWGLDDKDVAIIPKCIDTEVFSGWVGGDNKVLINCDWYQNKANTTGFKLLEQINKQLPIQLMGINPGVSSPAKDLNDLVNKYKNASVFLNTSSWLSCPLELLEAASVGAPIVSTKNADIEDYFIHGENAFLSNDGEEIVKYSKMLINDKNLAKTMGNNARQTIVDKFNKKIFIESYNKVFYNVIDKPNAILAN